MSKPLLIFLVIAAYIFIWLLISFLSSKGADNKTFFSAGRKMPWPLVAIAMLGAPITGVTFISVPGMVLHKGFSYLQMGFGFIVGYIIIARLLIPLYYKHNIISVYGFLQKRFGQSSYKVGAWLFFVSKILGISVRFLTVCAILQLLVFGPLGVPFVCSVIVSLVFVWISTYKGGVKSVIWGDILKSFCLILSIVLCLYFTISGMGISFNELSDRLANHESTRIFYFDDPSDAKYFWKQFIAGIFIVVAMTGLDQDMMQRSLACKNERDCGKNLYLSSVMQFVVMTLLLILGTIMLAYLENASAMVPEKGDNLFATVAFNEGIPLIVGILFVLGLVSSTYSSVSSALTSMTTTMTIDVMEAHKRRSQESLKSRRLLVHTSISILMAVFVLFFYYLNEEDAISTVYTLISYTDGPILGLFLFGIFTSKTVNEKWIPVVCILSPVLSWLVQRMALTYFGYQISFELLILNCGFTMLGMALISSPARREVTAGA